MKVLILSRDISRNGQITSIKINPQNTSITKPQMYRQAKFVKVLKNGNVLVLPVNTKLMRKFWYIPSGY